jgi:bifunctional ADP-heptose synthase (sugar kinase/adenylyltransferase)
MIKQQRKEFPNDMVTLIQPDQKPDPNNKDTRHKVVTVDELAAIVNRLKTDGKKVVQAHGTFDLLHLGHVKHLEAARAFGRQARQ